MTRQQVLIVSSHPLFREGIGRLLGDQADVVGAVARWEDARELPLERRPDVIIVDHDSPQLNAGDLAPLLWPGAEALRVIYVTLSGDKMTIHERHQVSGASEADLVRALKGERQAEPGQASRSTQQPQGRMERMANETRKRGYWKHIIAASVLVVLVAVVTGFALVSIEKFPRASTQAIVSDNLLDVEMWVIGFLFALVVVFMLYSLVVFRRKKGEEGDGDHFEGHTKLEITWTVLPLITVLIFAFVGAKTLQEVTAAQPDELTVDVTAFSWGWQFGIAEQGVSGATKLVLPVDQPVLFKLKSLDSDVIHNFWVPEFRVKQDLVPGVPTELRVTPDTVGSYRIRCNELCGTGHTNMWTTVDVVDRPAFDAWVAEQVKVVTPEEMARLGQELHASQGCIACHNVDGKAGGIGPSWKGIFNHDVPLADGTTAKADEAYLRSSILEPNLQVVQGYAPGLMPQNYSQVLSEEQITYLIEFMKTLEGPAQH